jgi:hypothetical protein
MFDGATPMTNPSTMLPIQHCCIWCHRRDPDVSFDESHVLPECVGNKHQQVLPPGIVCKPCNAYFGAKIEPTLLADPLFHVVAVFLQLVDPDDMNVFRERMFDTEHPPVDGTKRHLDLKVQVKDQALEIDISHTITGRLIKNYNLRDLALLSRAVHKIAFESLAWQVFDRRIENQPDLFSTLFNPVRAWAREGQPHGSVRPVLRRPNSAISPDWHVQLWKFENDFVVQVNLFADWYAVSLTSPSERVAQDLRQWVGTVADDMWIIGEKMVGLNKL